ncbi:MAG: hypothetical protein COW44_04635 [Flavobacteriaceae bacterium CG17_big_fil_post_rev_8_21_14_2_50_33_15]|nr:MAG: hypothetical protein COW44_04635 [Flavobacteriaceae bacterium CG17_big_fil_post_rev_8_21_14_2_50_33_15]
MNKFKFFSLLIIFSLLSCSNDDDSNNNTISFSQAYLSTAGNYSQGFNFELFLLDSKRNVDLNQYPAILGTGSLLYIAFLSDSNDLPDAGLYSVITGNSTNPYDIAWSWYKTAEIDTHETNDTFVITDGTLEISYQNNHMIFNYDINLISTDTEDTKHISGVYNQQIVITDKQLY